MIETVSAQTIELYTDLTPQRLEALRKASTLDLDEIHPATAELMSSLITPDRILTDYGRWALARAEEIEAGKFPPPLGPGWVEDTASGAAFLRRWRGYAWVRSVHLKALRDLYRQPGQAYRWLAKVYGYEALRELSSRGAAKGEVRFGYPWEPTPLGKWIVDMAIAYENEGGAK